jgi:hypothetical protein
MTKSWIFEGVEGLTRREVFGWWEKRRIVFNFLVGIAGVATWLLVLFAGSAAVRPGEDFEEPMAMILGPFVYAIFANICYTSGGVFDVIWYRHEPRVALFRTGLYFSIALTVAPGLWALYAWISTLITEHKLT